MNPFKWIDGAIGSMARIFAMCGARRHIRHTRKLAKMLRERARWRNIACAFCKASQDRKHADALDAACDYLVSTGEQ